ncbi:hypothetical protein EX30DRAFT_388753 [Ascodesmis nigricans]|uniref:Uncharacterized protein n=1 Tax=Ascodesmis nigricans TaxID=341454 RepID=A0A4S2MJG5_9PEZI|nr:hypothetical protein EX30DRAFT_388753 [Ascodesmis nigricans]
MRGQAVDPYDLIDDSESSISTYEDAIRPPSDFYSGMKKGYARLEEVIDDYRKREEFIWLEADLTSGKLGWVILLSSAGFGRFWLYGFDGEGDFYYDKDVFLLLDALNHHVTVPEQLVEGGGKDIPAPKKTQTIISTRFSTSPKSTAQVTATMDGKVVTVTQAPVIVTRVLRKQSGKPSIKTAAVAQIAIVGNDTDEIRDARGAGGVRVEDGLIGAGLVLVMGVMSIL